MKMAGLTSQILFLAMAAMLVLGFGCATPDPLAGFHRADEADMYKSKTITDDYESYIKTLSSNEQKYAGPILYFEGGTGQHAVKIMIGINSKVWEHVLIYDKDDKRIKTTKYVSGDYHS
jgi:hypothetical protein